MATNSYQSPSTMNALNTPATYTTVEPTPAATYGSAPTTSQPAPASRFNRAFLISIPGILKLVSVLLCFIAFVSVVTSWQCYGTHAFLATVTCLVIIMQVTIIIFFILRLDTHFEDIDFEFLDLFATSHDALYLLIASCVTINYCRFAGQIAGGAIGILAFLALTANVVIVVLARQRAKNISERSTGGR